MCLKLPDIDINQHEWQKLLLIFQELTVFNSDEEFSDSEDGIT